MFTQNRFFSQKCIRKSSLRSNFKILFDGSINNHMEPNRANFGVRGTPGGRANLDGVKSWIWCCWNPLFADLQWVSLYLGHLWPLEWRFWPESAPSRLEPPCGVSRSSNSIQNIFIIWRYIFENPPWGGGDQCWFLPRRFFVRSPIALKN